MGACISTPAKLAAISRRGLKMRQDRNNSPSSWDAEDKSGRRSSSGYLQPHRVLKDSSPGNIRDRYEMGKELGRGEFGITHECVEMETGERYACKMISKAKLRTEIDVDDVRREVEIMRHLPKHPNIVAFKEAFEDKEGIYLVMELCHGGELFDRIVARGHYTERAAAGIAKTILEIVKVCHEHGVIHRDLKPENFLFADGSETAQLKAIDFGLSIFFQEGQRFSDIVGSPYYMAPEVLRRNYGKQVDVWSTGVILYILLCGVPPFWAETEEGIAHAIIRGIADFERDPWPKVSEEAKDLIKAMLDMNPKTRISVTEVLEHPWIRNSENARNINLGDNVRSRINQFSLMNKFKKKVLRVVADNLPDDQMDSIIQLFHMMDTDKNGGLSFDELKDGLISLGQPVSDPDVRMLMEAADMDGNGTLSCDEFVTMSVHLRRIGNDEHLAQAFNCLDKNGDGYIDQKELGEALLEDNNALPCNDQLIKDIMLDIDLDKDGRISYQEFRSMMQTGADWKMASRQYSRALLNALSIKILRQSGQLK